MKVKAVMNKAVIIEHDMSLKDAARIMSDHNIGSLIVTQEKKIVGIITERDITKNVPSIDKRVSSFMSKDVVTIEDSDNIEDAALIMSENHIKRIPVINDGKLVGVITATDVLGYSDVFNEDFFFE